MKRFACFILAAAACAAPAMGDEPMEDARTLFFADFEGLPDGSPPPPGWWVEGGEKVYVQDGRIVVQADPRDGGAGGVCTVWNETPIAGDVKIEFDSQVIDSSIDANNINFFCFYSDPSGRPLFDTRAERASAAYGLYHPLNGYILTFLNDKEGEGGRYEDGSAKARIRLRRCPGFELLNETFDYHCRKGVTYRVELTRAQGRISCAIDGKTYVQAEDSQPWREGLIGLRTFKTTLWWDNIRVTALP
ncbi:MAG: hypothetical protein BWZ10_01950 [candidate division BRC1 bacterium ADurb.BinA364]|nr:MAG: hypothetical protein BWZ10_01950 [candidate division BRC1 bacterium ADurb.BinA364]